MNLFCRLASGIRQWWQRVTHFPWRKVAPWIFVWAAGFPLAYIGLGHRGWGWLALGCFGVVLNITGYIFGISEVPDKTPPPS